MFANIVINTIVFIPIISTYKSSHLMAPVIQSSPKSFSSVKGAVMLEREKTRAPVVVTIHSQFKLAPNCNIFQPYFSSVTSLQNMTNPKLSLG